MDRVKDPADPERCQGRTPEGQCWYRIHECRLHHGAIKAAEEDLRQYRLTLVRHREQLDLLKTGDPVYLLSEALAMVHMLVEKRMNLAAVSPDLFRDHGIINTLHRTIERLSRSLTILEERLKTLKGKSVVYRAGQQFVHVCKEHLKDQDIVRAIELRTLAVIYGANNQGVGEKAKEVPPQGWRPQPGQTMFQLNSNADHNRLATLSRSPELKRLTECIGLQVIIVEEIWNSCNGDDETLVSAASEINDHVRTLEKLVKSAYEIEETLGNLLSRETRMGLGQQISQILVDELQHLDGYEAIIDDIWEKAQVAFTQTEAPRLS